jgi:hypothetical protein
MVRWIRSTSPQAMYRCGAEGKYDLAVAEDQTGDDFEPASSYRGPRPGMHFACGDRGLGYYADARPSREEPRDSTASLLRWLEPRPPPSKAWCEQFAKAEANGDAVAKGTLGERCLIGGEKSILTNSASLRARAGFEPLTLFASLKPGSGAALQGSAEDVPVLEPKAGGAEAVDATDWRPLPDEHLAAAVVPEGPKSMQECTEVWRNVQCARTGERVTKEYMDWVKAGKKDDKAAPLPFGANGTAGSWWYCEECCDWYQCVRQYHSCSSGTPGGKAKLFGPQFIG